MSRRRVVVVGAGMGGLAAALRLARAGHDVRILEARSALGGLASGFEVDGFSFDHGPYVLLDRPGLDWAFRSLGLEVEAHLDLRRLEQVYEVARPDGPTLRFLSSLDQTAEGFERLWPGAGDRYRRFVRRMTAHNRRLRPLLYRHPSRWALLRGGAWRSARLLLQPLAAVLRASGLPAPLQDAVGIWTHVAAQSLAQAPSVLAFVPALVHEVGAFYPVGGIGAVPRALTAAAIAAGVAIETGVTVRRIVTRDGRVTGLETTGGRLIEADAVVSNASGVGTYLDLTPELALRAAERLRRLPLQSPGAAAYLAARGDLAGPYLRFLLPGDGQACRLWIRPATVDAGLKRGEWWPARLLAPMGHAEASRLGREGQGAFLDRVLEESWWRAGVEETRVLARRMPADWGAEFHLHRDSMNPVMTARLMRAGRLAHRSPWLRGLYLAGSATHPGQWVSFCAISGVLAADRLGQDLG